MDNAHFKVPFSREYYRQAAKGCIRPHHSSGHPQRQTEEVNTSSSRGAGNIGSHVPANRMSGYLGFSLQPSHASACYVRQTPPGQRLPAPVVNSPRTLTHHPAQPRLPPPSARKTDLPAPAQTATLHNPPEAGVRQSEFIVRPIYGRVIPYNDRYIPDPLLRAEVHRDFLALEDWILNPWVDDQLLFEISRTGEQWKHDETLVNWAMKETLWTELDDGPVDPAFTVTINLKVREVCRLRETSDLPDAAFAQLKKCRELQQLQQQKAEHSERFGKYLKLTPLVGKELRKLTESERLDKLLPHAMLQGYTRTAQWCLENGANIKTAMTTLRQLKSRSDNQPGNITEHRTTTATAPSTNRRSPGIGSFSNDINTTLLEVIADTHIDMAIQADWLLANGASLTPEASAALNQALNTSLYRGYLANARWLIDKGATLQAQHQFEQAMSHYNTRVAQWLMDNHQAKQNSGKATSALLSYFDGYLSREEVVEPIYTHQPIDWLLEVGGASLEELRPFAPRILERALEFSDPYIAGWLLKHQLTTFNSQPEKPQELLDKEIARAREKPKEDRKYMIDFLQKQVDQESASNCYEPPKKKIC
ncbi:hypothetical protein [Endozoicomonas sp. GU-1]|uniref:hypothetical protein n=1 Tax=Endozoicomonas sp. GU-1 TaxID=3009078 RepID=UPI0022B3C53F|nr:hypothetical protein [Endozoicomonas sp. GU-1]WBA80781.1 hypothetical protein O2T12_21105 [Endozoicomonas sp. GU-1]WBA88345.1 hypothetical protein O3276_10305 [Endozoicomonas sp. GU-1]